MKFTVVNVGAGQPRLDRHIAEMQTRGRMFWQCSSGYNQLSRIETQIERWKAAIGLKAKYFESQQTEIEIGTFILHKMNKLSRPVFNQIT